MKNQKEIIALLGQEFNNYVELLQKNDFKVRLADFSLSPFPKKPAIYLVLTPCSQKEACREFISLVKSVNSENLVIAMAYEENFNLDMWDDLSHLCDDIMLFPMTEKEFLRRIEIISYKKRNHRSIESQVHKARQLAHTDELTGIGNRRSIVEIINKEIKRSKRTKNPLSLLLFDIDYFKLINDFFGHQMGDTVLRQIASMFPGLLRDTDYCARYGGDEFIILLVDTDLKGAQKVAEKLRSRVEKHPFGKAFNEINVTLSIGISSFSPDMDRRIFIEQADKALYLAKNSGRNTWVVYDPEKSIYPEPGIPIFQPTILCIEDNPDIKEIIALYLKDRNVRLITAPDGNTGLKNFRENEVDLVLLDIYLPDMSGFDVCEKIKVESRHDYIPVMMISALNDEEGIIKGYKVGADDYIVKPLDINILFEKMKVLLRIKHQFNDKVRRYHIIDKLGPQILRNTREQALSRACLKIAHRLNNYTMRADLIKNRLLKYLDSRKEELSRSVKTNLSKQAEKISGIWDELCSFTSILENVGQINPPMKFERIDINQLIPELVENVKNELQEKYSEKDIIVSLSSLNSKSWIKGNRESLYSIIYYIIENSIQHSLDQVRLTIEITIIEHHVQLCLADEGRGVLSRNLEKVFEPFFQEDEHKHGLGLGLYFVRVLVSRLGGNVCLKSEKMKGTTLEIKLPFFEKEARSLETKVQRKKITFPEFRILLIEDEQEIAVQTKEHLAQIPWVKKVAFCNNGYSAFKIINAQHEYNVFIVDLSIPGISGWHILEELKLINSPKIIIVITGLKSVSEEFLIRSLNVQAVLYKPFTLEHLAEVLKTYYSREA